MQRQAHARLLRHRDYRLEEVGDVGPHLVEGARAFFRQGRQAFHAVKVHACDSSAASSGLLVVAFHGAVRVEVVFDHGDADLAGGLDRLPDLFNLLIAARRVSRKPSRHLG